MKGGLFGSKSILWHPLPIVAYGVDLPDWLWNLNVAKIWFEFFKGRTCLVQKRIFIAFLSLFLPNAISDTFVGNSFSEDELKSDFARKYVFGHNSLDQKVHKNAERDTLQ